MFAASFSPLHFSLTSFTVNVLFCGWVGGYAHLHTWMGMQSLFLWVCSVQFKIVSMCLEKPISTQPLGSFPSIVFETVPVFIGLMMTLSCPFKEDCLAFPLSKPLVFVPAGSVSSSATLQTLMPNIIIFSSYNLTCWIHTTKLQMMTVKLAFMYLLFLQYPIIEHSEVVQKCKARRHCCCTPGKCLMSWWRAFEQ